jgi:hypothetical protein
VRSRVIHRLVCVCEPALAHVGSDQLTKRLAIAASGNGTSPAIFAEAAHSQGAIPLNATAPKRACAGAADVSFFNWRNCAADIDFNKH